MAEMSLTRAELLALVRGRLGLFGAAALDQSAAVALVRSLAGVTVVAEDPLPDDAVRQVVVRLGVDPDQAERVAVDPDTLWTRLVVRLGIEVAAAAETTVSQDVAAVRARIQRQAPAFAVGVAAVTRATLRTAVLAILEEANLSAAGLSALNEVLIAAARWVRGRCWWVATGADLATDGTTTDGDALAIQWQAVALWYRNGGLEAQAKEAEARAEERVQVLARARDEDLTGWVEAARAIDADVDGPTAQALAAAMAARQAGAMPVAEGWEREGRDRLQRIRWTRQAQEWIAGARQAVDDVDDEAVLSAAAALGWAAMGRTESAKAAEEQLKRRLTVVRARMLAPQWLEAAGAQVNGQLGGLDDGRGTILWAVAMGAVVIGRGDAAAAEAAAKARVDEVQVGRGTVIVDTLTSAGPAPWTRGQVLAAAASVAARLGRPQAKALAADAERVRGEEGPTAAMLEAILAGAVAEVAQATRKNTSQHQVALFAVAATADTNPENEAGGRLAVPTGVRMEELGAVEWRADDDATWSVLVQGDLPARWAVQADGTRETGRPYAYQRRLLAGLPVIEVWPPPVVAGTVRLRWQPLATLASGDGAVVPGDGELVALTMCRDVEAGRGRDGSRWEAMRRQRERQIAGDQSAMRTIGSGAAAYRQSLRRW